MLACARFFYSTGRDGSWGRPLDRWLVAIHPRWGSPWLGTLLVGAAGMALCFVDLRQLEILSGTGLIAIYAGLAVASIVARRRGQIRHGGYRMPLYPLAPFATFAGLGLITWATWLDHDNGRAALIATVVQMGLAAAYYWLVLRGRGWTAVVPTDPA